MVLPEGFALPPLRYLLPLLAAVALVAGSLWRIDPYVSERTVVSLAPWMVVGSSLHVLYQVGLIPAAVRPLFGTPSVYLLTFSVAGAVWVLALLGRAAMLRVSVPRALAASGTGVALLLVSAALAHGVRTGSLRLFWPFVGLVVAVVLTGLLWAATRYAYPGVATVTGAVGALALFGHTLDGVSTAVGVDLLGFGERAPVSRAVMEVASTLPTADVVGVGWLFVLVKLTVAELVVLLFADYVAHEPEEGYLLLGLVAAVGLGPGAYNLLLFMISA